MDVLGTSRAFSTLLVTIVTLAAMPGLTWASASVNLDGDCEVDTVLDYGAGQVCLDDLAGVGLIGNGIKGDRGRLPDLDVVDIDLNDLDIDHQVGQVINTEGLCSRRDNRVGNGICLGDRPIERGGELERIQVLLCSLGRPVWPV